LVYLYRTNILLAAKLGDFGFSQEFVNVVGDRSIITATIVAKIVGYSAPEMDMCHISPKTDMYSYGVVRKILLCFDTDTQTSTYGYLSDRMTILFILALKLYY